MTDAKQKPREWWIGRKKLLIDDEDFSFLNRFKWHITRDKTTFYAKTNVRIGSKQTSISMHRLICGLPTGQIDHKNRNGIDNRKCNLRFCTTQQNQFNRVRKNKHGFRGVYKLAGVKTYSFQIQRSGVKIHGHGFKTAADAARAYDVKNRELHGEFGIRNFET